jgi:RNA polymerase sigma-70 factor (ECF subfamily)
VRELVNVLPARGASVYEGAVASQLRSRIRAIIQMLPPKEREVLTLSVFRDFNSLEIAAHLRISTSSVRSRLFRARNFVAHLMADDAIMASQALALFPKLSKSKPVSRESIAA